MTNEEKIQLLAQKMLILGNNIDKHKSELELLKQQLELLKQSGVQLPVKPVIPEIKTEEPKIVLEEIKEKPVEIIEPIQKIQHPVEPLVVPIQQKIQANPRKSFNLEEYIGGKLVSIIGIIILVIGIAIGVKFAIDKDLINELTRTIFGFVAGGILLTLAFFLKKKYAIFSAIILSGAVATMFFTTFVGFAMYHIYPRGFAFTLMFLIMAFTVFCAHAYNYEIIALIGLVGAYAIPPLLSDGSGKIEYMFTYMAIINCGILILSFIKHWRWVNYCAYGLTWIIVASWVTAKYKPDDFVFAFSFITIFFLTFYTAFIAYKIIKKINFTVMDVITLMSNSFIFFGLGYYILNDEYHQQYQGLFCIFNALIHLCVAMMAHKNKVADKNILFFILGLVFTFITIAVPVQLEGHWVTLVWFTEMLMLFWLSKRFDVPFYAYISYTLSILGFGSLAHDWGNGYGSPAYNYLTGLTTYFDSIFNKYFMDSIYSVCAFTGILIIHHKFKGQAAERKKDVLWPVAHVSTIIFLILISYMAFMFEIVYYFDKWYDSTLTNLNDNGYAWSSNDSSITQFKSLWVMIYNIVFVSSISLLNYRFFKNKVISWFAWSAILISTLIMLSGGLSILGELRESYFNLSANYQLSWRTDWFLDFRYVFLPFIVFSLVVLFIIQKSDHLKVIRGLGPWIMHGAIIILLCNQLSFFFICSHPFDQYHYAKVASGMGYTILWGLYSLGLIIFGIIRKGKMLRIMGISMFGLTLIKLISDSISMTLGYKLIVYCSIGAILMIVGFLYQRFKHVIFQDDNESTNENKLPHE